MRFRIIMLLALAVYVSACTNSPKRAADYPIRPVPFTSVKLTDDFWAPRIKKNASVTIPIAFDYCESTGRVRNFEIAGGLDTGKFQTLYPFDDSDAFKIMEGAAYSLQTFPDPKLESYLDTLIYKIGLAQEDDGYLYTNRTIAEMNGEGLHEWASTNRWELDSILSHELYNIGHLYEAAVAHYQATGKRSLLDIALKSADLVAKDFLEGGVKVYPGHQVIEMGLVKLYRVTGDEKYLKLARYFLDIRGPKGQQYNQAHILPVHQHEAVGHSVRATYMYSGMADIAAIQNDTSYLNAITRIWEDLTYTKMYVTGGIGATGGNEGFAEPYNLPNLTAYCETCASIGDIFTNERLFLLHGNSQYIDILEKTLYNSMLSGVSLSGDRFFYPNPLESDGRHNRQAWFGCACCPSNVARFVPAIPGYVYATGNSSIYVNLYVSNDAMFSFGGDSISISQKSGFPWTGDAEITLNPSKAGKFSLNLRIPGWARNEAIPGDLYTFADRNIDTYIIKVNGEEIKPGNLVEGYAVIDRKWAPGDIVNIEFPMPVRKVVADEKVTEDHNKMAIQRGPVIFCAEWPDNTGKVRELSIKKDVEFSTEFAPGLLGGTQVVKTAGDNPVTLIPYALWNNRGPGEMTVWLSTEE